MPRRLPGDDAVTPVVATLLLVTIALALTTAVLYVALEARKAQNPPPRQFAFQVDAADDAILVTRGPHGANWNQVSVTGCSDVPTGPVRAGDRVRGCAGEVLVVDVQTNTLLVSHRFA